MPTPTGITGRRPDPEKLSAVRGSIEHSFYADMRFGQVLVTWHRGRWCVEVM